LLGKSSLLIKFPEGELAFAVANLSASSFPTIPEWVGIQLILVVDPLYLRQLSRFLISAMRWFIGGRDSFDCRAGVREDVDYWNCRIRCIDGGQGF
jgi:hypothetical protein